MPIIKWTGSKRSQSKRIIQLFPKNINTYYEPFCGGCSVLFALLENINPFKIKSFICSDINEDLIALWKMIKNNPNDLYTNYCELHYNLVNLGSIDKKKDFYNEIRSRFNKERNPVDFFFINRTSYNGLIRYNSNGDFNVSFHLKRNGITIDNLKELLFYSAKLLNDYNVQFSCQSYDTITPSNNDLVYLDPPYQNSIDNIYFCNFDTDRFLNWLSIQKFPYILSYDGFCKDNISEKINDCLFDKHIYFNAGKSSFRTLKSGVETDNVYESLYIKNIDTAYINKQLKYIENKNYHKLF